MRTSGISISMLSSNLHQMILSIILLFIFFSVFEATILSDKSFPSNFLTYLVRIKDGHLNSFLSDFLLIAIDSCK